MAFLINLNQVYYCLIFRRACYFTFPLRFIQIFKNTSRKWTKVCNWKCVNPSRSLPLSVHEAAWARVYNPPPPTRTPWNLNFYTWYEAEIYASDTSLQKMLIDEVIVSVMLPTCILQTIKTIFSDVIINEKITSSMYFFYQGELPVKYWS